MKFSLFVVVVIFSLGCSSLVQGQSKSSKKQEATESFVSKEFLNYEAPYEVRKDFPYYLSGFDLEGRPTWVFEFGKYPVRKYAELGGQPQKDAIKNFEQQLARWQESPKKYSTEDKPVSEYNVISDLDGYKLSELSHLPTVQLTLQMTIKFANAVRSNSRYLFGINSNSVFDTMFTLMKPLMGSVGDRIEIYGSNESKWKPRLLKALGKDALQKWYGGEAKSTVEVYG